jgi:two-component sensor histidine kinase
MTSRPFSVPADDLPEMMLLASPDGEIIAINQAAREDLGLDAGCLGSRLCDLVADPPEKVMAFVRLCSSTREALPGTLSFHTPGGIIDCRCDGHLTTDGMVYLRCRPKAASNQAFTVLNEKIADLAREVVIRMRTEERLQELLKSREILIQELHHRIGNSIQVAISLARLQMREIPAGPTGEEFLKYSNRLKAIGLVYRTLYQDQDFARLDISTFVSDLCTELGRTYRGANASFSIRTDASLLSLDQAVPFALIVNELITNALVHAFEPGGRGSVQVILQHSPPDRLELTVADDGIGISAEQMKPGSAGTGLNLVRMLVRQLGASLEVDHSPDHSPGTTFRVAFKDATGSAGDEKTV